MLDDIIQATRQTLLERIASPLLGSFTLAWCAWNWKFLIIIFSSATVSQTFRLVEQEAFPDASVMVFKGILLPLISALIYVFVYPYPARYIYEFTLRRQRELNETKKRIADETPLTIEESRRLRAEYVEYERKQKAIVAELNEEISRLNAALEEKEMAEPNEDEVTAEPVKALPVLPDPPIFLEESQLAVLRLMDHNGGRVSESSVISGLQTPKIKAEFDIGELYRRNLISRQYDRSYKSWMLDFTHEGRKALLDNMKEQRQG